MDVNIIWETQQIWNTSKVLCRRISATLCKCLVCTSRIRVYASCQKLDNTRQTVASIQSQVSVSLVHSWTCLFIRFNLPPAWHAPDSCRHFWRPCRSIYDPTLNNQNTQSQKSSTSRECVEASMNEISKIHRKCSWYVSKCVSIQGDVCWSTIHAILEITHSLASVHIYWCILNTFTEFYSISSIIETPAYSFISCTNLWLPFWLDEWATLNDVTKRAHIQPDERIESEVKRTP